MPFYHLRLIFELTIGASQNGIYTNTGESYAYHVILQRNILSNGHQWCIAMCIKSQASIKQNASCILKHTILLKTTASKVSHYFEEGY